MAGTCIQSGSSVIQANLKRQREEKEKQTPHAATLDHFKNQEIFNSNQIRKNIERHDRMVTTILVVFSFFFSSKDHNIFEIKKKYKKKTTFTQSSQ